MSINAKCGNLCVSHIAEHEKVGYVPHDIGLRASSGDYVEFSYCLNCGQIQGNFPTNTCALEKEEWED